MSSIPVSDVVRSEPELATALGLCVGSLRRIAEYELDDTLNSRMRTLGERKDFLPADEHAELMSLVGFTERRTREKLDAKLNS
ncbi:MAG: hypothetical protein O3A00_02015 [Planctomycetota bacterium]|nr:hypothetical protein [Planctomycetota bacterium]